MITINLRGVNFTRLKKCEGADLRMFSQFLSWHWGVQKFDRYIHTHIYIRFVENKIQNKEKKGYRTPATRNCFYKWKVGFFNYM